MHAFRRSGRFTRWVVFWVLLCFPAVALGITPKEEEELSREFMKVAMRQMAFVEDPLIVDYVNRVGQRIISVMPPQPYNYRFYVIDADEYNAFAIPAGFVFINSGLLAAMDTEDELAGILGHETRTRIGRRAWRRTCFSLSSRFRSGRRSADGY